MKKTLMLLILICVAGLGIYIFGRKECRNAYSNGYHAGFSTDICTCGFKNVTEWVGIGNEEYNEIAEKITGRNSKYWWAE